MSNSPSNYKPIDDNTKPLHIALVVPRTLIDPGHRENVYYQSVCSCGWSGDYKTSKLIAQEDKCPNQ